MKLAWDKNKVLGNLQKLFYGIGWLMTALTVISLAVAAVTYLRISASNLSGFFPTESFLFSFVTPVQAFFSGIANATFAFLMSAVFRMIRKGKPVRMAQAEKFLKLCCGSFLILGVMNVILFIQRTILDLEAEFSAGSSYVQLRDHALSFLTHTIALTEYLTPFFYAVTIFVLFHHFSKMVAFESEVV
jgi:hypothetical protein